MGDQFGQIAGRLSRLENNINRLMAQQTDFSRYGSAFPTDNLFDGRQFYRTDLGMDFYYDSSSFNGPAAGWYKINTGFQDTFDRADSATRMGSTSDKNFVWLPQGAATFGISSNKAYSVTDTNGDLTWVETQIYNPTIQEVISGTLNSITNFRVPQVVFRLLDANNFLLADMVNGNIRLVKFDGGVATALSTTATTTADNTDYIIDIQCVDTTVNVWLDGILKINAYVLGSGAATDIKYVGYGKIGHRLAKAGAPATNARWNSLIARQAS